MDMTKIVDLGISLGVKILYSIAVIIICSICIKIADKFIRKIFGSRLASNRQISENKNKTLMTVVLSVIRYVIYFIAIVSILSKFGVEIASVIAAAGVLAVAVGLAAQTIVSDVISGFFILLEDQFSVGDLITIDGETGVVEALNMKTTRLRSADGTVHIIPNGKITKVTNRSKGFMNAVVDVGIDYSEDMDRVLEILQDEMDEFAKTGTGLHSTPVVVGIIGLDDSAVTVRIVAECDAFGGAHLRNEREIRLAVKKRLDKEHISIPFPQRTVHIVKEEA